MKRKYHFDGYGRAIAWGALCGLRSLMGPALASHRLQHRIVRTPLQRRLANPRVRRALEALALAELIADKTPFIPARVAPAPLLGRAAAGGLVGLVSAPPAGLLWRRPRASRRRDALARFLAGAAGALASAYAAYWSRRAATKRFRLSTAAGGLMEDTVALLAASRLEIGSARSG